MITTIVELENIKESHKNKKIGFCSGVFDLMHKGHLNFIKQARMACDILVVAVNSDFYVTEIKKTFTIIDQDTRMQLIDSLKFVDYVLLLDPGKRLEIVKMLKPNVITLPDNHDTQEKVLNEFKSLGIEINIILYTKDVSTTEIKKAFKEKFDLSGSGAPS